MAMVMGQAHCISNEARRQMSCEITRPTDGWNRWVFFPFYVYTVKAGLQISVGLGRIVGDNPGKHRNSESDWGKVSCRSYKKFKKDFWLCQPKNWYLDQNQWDCPGVEGTTQHVGYKHILNTSNICCVCSEDQCTLEGEQRRKANKYGFEGEIGPGASDGNITKWCGTLSYLGPFIPAAVDLGGHDCSCSSEGTGVL